MPITFHLLSPAPLPVDVATLQLDQLIGMASDDVARIPIWLGNQQVPCGEVFSVSGTADDQTLVFMGDCGLVKSIGTRLSQGTIRVEGNAGRHLGAYMTGGEIRVSGNVGDWAGAEMRNGRIYISGNAGDQAGGAYRGSKKGMMGGEILIRGHAGCELGARQRRGLIAVGGDAGEGVGVGMIAGTIMISGQPGPHCGIGMKRGTILLLSTTATIPILSTFRYATTTRPTFLQLYFHHLIAAGFPLDAAAFTANYRIYRGDLLELGLGEVLCREA